MKYIDALSIWITNKIKISCSMPYRAVILLQMREIRHCSKVCIYGDLSQFSIKNNNPLGFPQEKKSKPGAPGAQILEYIRG